MKEFHNLPASKLISPSGFECDCGKTHIARGLRSINIGSGIISTLPSVLRELSISKPFIVTDKNEYEAAGRQAEALLLEAGVPYRLHVIPTADGERVAPAELATGSVALNFDVSCDGILCVGSGVMNDLCKVMSNITGRPSVVIATAPSMDGYASDGAAMEVNNIKLSLKQVIPAALICDTDIMAEAPMHMLHAGLGDMMGKFSALSEWKIARLILGESYCAETAKLVGVSLDKIINASSGISERNRQSIAAITEGLILSGIAMAFAETSRPASGLEHYFSHCWEMMAIARGEECELHGIQVGVGTILTLKIYEHLKDIRPTMERVYTHADSFDDAAWEANIRRVFSDTADDIIAMEKKTRKNERGGRNARAERIIANWDEILKIAEDTPKASDIEAIMKSVGMPTRPSDIGVSNRDVIDAFICSRDVREKYLLSSMIWDIGYMEEFAKWLEENI